MKKPEVLVTGANGFIGQHLVNYLGEMGFGVTAMIRRGSWPIFNLDNGVRVVYGDLLDQRSLEEVMKSGMVVVNLAVNSYDPKESYKVNVGGLENLIMVGRGKRLRIIQFGTQATKIARKGVYAESKSLADKVVENSGWKYVIVRPSLVYGGGQKGLFNKIRTLVSKLPMVPVFGNGKSLVYPVYVEDVCRLVGKIIVSSKGWNQSYDFGGPAVSYNELYGEILLWLGKRPSLIHIPIWLGMTAGKIFRLLSIRNPPFYIDNVLGSTQKIVCRTEPAIRRFGVRPVGLKEGINKSMGSNKLKVALVGLGKMGMLHLSILATMAEVEVVAIIDNNQKAIKTIWSMGYKVKSYKTLDEAMAVEKIEAVWVLTPNWTHKEIVKKAINNGIAVLVEKPATINEKDLEEYRRWLSKKVAVGYVLLYSRGFYRLKELIDSGKYGKVKSFRGEYLVEEVLEPKKGWMYEKKKSGGGVMINPGPHIFSLASWLFNGLKVESVELRRIKSVEVEDSADIGLKTGGVIGRIILNWSVKGKIRPEIKLEIETDKARLTSDGRMVEIKNKQGIKLIRETEIDQIYEQAFNINRESFGEAYFNEDKDFVRWVRGEQAGVRNDLSLALKTEGLINEAYKLAKNG